jgi:phosphate:Na+ symporter
MQDLIFGLIGGLGLFLFGMKTMSEGLKKVASDRLRNILQLFTRNSLIAALVGAGFTALIQSSSAMTVMVVGFVNAGLLTLRQAIGVVMGANIGTTATAWLVSMAAFKITAFSLPAIGIGFALNIFGWSKKSKYWGQFLLGFGLLFLGLSIMKETFSPIKDSQVIKDFFVKFCQYPILGVLAGTLVTMILQSSSATIAIVQVLAFEGLIDFAATIPLILGDNIGTTITATIASVGTSAASRQTARAHTIFNVIGVCYMLPLVYLGLYQKAIEAIVPGQVTSNNIMVYIAVAHSVFNIFNTLLFLPLIGVLEKMSIKLTGKEKFALTPSYLERHLLFNPPVAISQAIKEMVRMARLSKESLNDAMTGFFNDDTKALAQVPQKEEIIDNFQEAITKYLVEISEQNLEEKEASKLPALLHSVNDIERIGDHAENLMELAERKIEEKLPFSEQAMDELKKMFNETDQMLELVILAMETDRKEEARLALKRDDILNKLQIQLRESHIQRLQNRECWVLSGIVFLDIVNNLEKVGDHLKNISLAIIQQRL